MGLRRELPPGTVTFLFSGATAALLGDDGLRDLGAHRLKELSAPERIYQLGDGDFPALRSLHQTNLPIPTTPFLGREREFGDIIGLRSRDGRGRQHYSPILQGFYQAL